RDARPPQPVISAMPSRLPTSAMRPTLLNAACAATSLCQAVRTTDHISRLSSGFIAPPLLLDCGAHGTPISAGIVADMRRRPPPQLRGTQVCKLLTPYAASLPVSSAKSRSTHSTSCDPSEASKANERVTQSLGPVTER